VIKLVQFKDSVSKRETMVNPEKVQLLEDETDHSGARVIIFGPGQSVVVDGNLEDVARQLSK